MVRAAATGLATAFFRLYLLDALATGGPARPAALLAAIAVQRLPFATGAFSRALQSLIEGGHIVPALAGAVALSALGAGERDAERERWAAMLPTAQRLVGETPPPTAPAVAEDAPPDYRVAQAAEIYLDRVLMTALRERIALARDGGPSFALSLARLDLSHPLPATRRTMLHRAMRGTLGAASALLGGDADVYRYGEAGVAAIAPLAADPLRGGRNAALLELRLDELARSMTSAVRSFNGARWRSRSGSATWSTDHPTSRAFLEAVAAMLDGDVAAQTTAA